MQNRTIRLSPEMMEKLEQIAELEDRTVSDCIRQALKVYVQTMLALKELQK